MIFKNKTIKFAEDFPKLQDDFFSTIRSNNKCLKTGQEYLIKTPTEEFRAVLTKQYETRLYEIPDDILTHDTNTKTSEEAIKKIQEFYPYLKAIDHVRLVWFARIKEESHSNDGWVWCHTCGIPFKPGVGDSIFFSFQGHKPQGECKFCREEKQEVNR